MPLRLFDGVAAFPLPADAAVVVTAVVPVGVSTAWGISVESTVFAVGPSIVI